MIEQQLQFLISIARFRTPKLDQFFIFLNSIDSEQFLFILLPIIWLGISYKWGIRVFYSVVISSYINYLLKIFFHEPRPFIHMPDLAVLTVGQNSFPSGAAQTSFLLAGLLIYSMKTRWSIIVGVLYALIMGFSRLYLGVHYPTDIIGGYIVGLIILLAFIYGHCPLERAIARRPYISFALGALIPLSIMIINPSSNTFHFMSALMSAAVGVFFSLFYGLYIQNTHRPFSVFLRSLIGVSLVFILYECMQHFLLNYLSISVLVIVETSTITLWMTLFASPLLKWIIPGAKWMNQNTK